MGVINKTTEKINDLLDKVEDLPSEGLVGKTPVFDIGVVTTVSAGSPADVDIRTNGVDENGNPIYLLDFDIPKGKDGTSTGEGGEILSVDWTDVLNKPDWVDSSTKPSYTASEVGALPSDTVFKTINGESILGVGDIQIQGGSSSGNGVGSTYPGYKNAEIFNDYNNNIAAGAHAHAEGRETNATGPRAHAEGYLTKVFAADAHAEGRETWCLGSQGHVEGMYGIVFGALSHVEGIAFEENLPGESVRPIILNNEEEIRQFYNSKYFTREAVDIGYNLIIDYESMKNDYCIHASFGERSHVEGVNNICFANTSHVEGYNNVCGNKISSHGVAITHDCIHIEGHNNYVSNHPTNRSVHLGGGFCVVNNGSYSFAHGFGLEINNDYEVAFGKYNNSSSTADGKKVLFSYGIGTETARKNALTIYDDGTVSVPQIASERIDTAIANSENLSTQVTEIQSSLLAEINSLREEVQALYDYIINNPGGGEQTGKAYVIGITLIFRESETINVSNDTLNITDSEITVENETLII